MKRRILALLSAMTLLFVGCFEDDSSSVSLSLDVRDGKTSVKTGEEVTFEAYASGVDDITLYWKVDGDVSDQQNDWISKGKSVFSTTFNSEGTHKVHVMAWSSTAEIVTKSKTIEVSKKDDNNGGGDDTPSDYPWHHNIITSLFWVGEEPNADNHFIQNISSAWDGKWFENFGSVEDDPHLDSLDRGSDGFPKNYKGTQNPYYFALPYNDFGSLVSDLNENPVHDKSLTHNKDEYGYKDNRYDVVPWASDSSNVGDWESMCKNRWIEIKINGKSCYAQWEDSGPFYYNDVDYVFGTSRPKNEANKNNYDNLGAGLDVSPAVMFYLGQNSPWDWKKASGQVESSWRFVNDEDVPAGPWKNVVTKNQKGGWN